MLRFLLGLQGGCTKYCCFLCLWDSRGIGQHYIQKVWPEEKQLIPDIHSVNQGAVAPKQKSLLPALHIKLGRLKQFVKTLDPNSAALHHIRKTFPHLSDAKVKGSIFTGPQIHVMLTSRGLEQLMTVVEKNAWEASRMIMTYFPGNNKCENYEVVEYFIQHYEALGCRMSVKLHYLHSQLELFRPNLGDVSEEQDERFHQDTEAIEKSYQGCWDAAMMADYIWGLVSVHDSSHKLKCTSAVRF
jgi:hypothetical protein